MTGCAIFETVALVQTVGFASKNLGWSKLLGPSSKSFRSKIQLFRYLIGTPLVSVLDKRINLQQLISHDSCQIRTRPSSPSGISKILFLALRLFPDVCKRVCLPGMRAWMKTKTPWQKTALKVGRREAKVLAVRTATFSGALIWT